MKLKTKKVVAGLLTISTMAVVGVAGSNFISDAQNSGPTQGQLTPEQAQQALEQQQQREQQFQQQLTQGTQVQQQQTNQQQQLQAPTVQPTTAQEQFIQQQQNVAQQEAVVQGNMPKSGPEWDGTIFTLESGEIEGPSGYESAVSDDLQAVLDASGLEGDISYQDGIAYLNDKVFLFYNQNVQEIGSIIQTSRGEGIVVGNLNISGDPTHVGIAVQ